MTVLFRQSCCVEMFLCGFAPGHEVDVVGGEGDGVHPNDNCVYDQSERDALLVDCVTEGDVSLIFVEETMRET